MSSIHAFRDLKPYVCTIGGKECDRLLFGDRSSWFNHELTCHRALHTCTLCKRPSLTSKELRSHITATHGHFEDRDVQLLQDGGLQSILTFNARHCPFCDEWADLVQTRADPLRKGKASTSEVPVSASRFKKHVALHQEQLAIFSLPRATKGDSTTGSQSAAGSVSSISLPSIGSLSGQPQLFWSRDDDDPRNGAPANKTNSHIHIVEDVDDKILQEDQAPEQAIADGVSGKLQTDENEPWKRVSAAKQNFISRVNSLLGADVVAEIESAIGRDIKQSLGFLIDTLPVEESELKTLVIRFLELAGIRSPWSLLPLDTTWPLVVQFLTDEQKDLIAVEMAKAEKSLESEIQTRSFRTAASIADRWREIFKTSLGYVDEKLISENEKTDRDFILLRFNSAINKPLMERMATVRAQTKTLLAK